MIEGACVVVVCVCVVVVGACVLVVGDCVVVVGASVVVVVGAANRRTAACVVQKHNQSALPHLR